jgi:ribosomal protein L11 methylase PrmA
MKKINSSFRDPAGYVFLQDGLIHRKINARGFSDYEMLESSGLYHALLKKKLIIPHQVISRTESEVIIKPIQVPFISYGYEWCFSQYQDAALLTLEIQKIALQHGMTLKDASVYNVQFYEGRPVFIDTLSFEKLDPTQPWVAYKQFCQHFLNPLALMSTTDIKLQKLMLAFVDGIPLDLAAKLLPFKTRFKLGLLMHIHLHAKAEKKYENVSSIKKPLKRRNFPVLALVDSLESTVKKLKLTLKSSQWAAYYSDTNYEKDAFDYKIKIVGDFIEKINPATLIDLGSNDGTFTRIAAGKNILSVACDIDPLAVERNYQLSKSNKEKFILPLAQDLTNPSADIGWHHQERDSFLTRIKGDCVMALALIHHLAISNNLPLIKIAAYLAEMGNDLIIEFVPKSDSKVKKLLATRVDVFPDYTIEKFEEAFANFFVIIKKESVLNSERTLYWMKKN